MRSVAKPTIGSIRIFHTVSYSLVFLMLTCLIMIINSLIRNALPNWSFGAISVIAFLVMVDRFVMHPRLKVLNPSTSEWMTNFGAHWIVIVLLIRSILSYSHGLQTVKADLALLARGDFTNFITVEFVATSLVAFTIWYLAGQFLDLLDIIGLDQAQALAMYEDVSRSEANYVPAHQRLVSLIFSLGIVQVILTAITRIDLQALFTGVQGVPRLQILRFSGAESGVLLYFLLGLALISLGRLLTLLTQWIQRRIQVDSRSLQKQWTVYSFYFIFILIMIVAILPTGDSFGFFTVLGTLTNFLLSILFFLAQVVIVLVAILFSLPFILFGKGQSFINRLQAPPVFRPPPLDSTTQVTHNMVWELFRSIFLWGALVAIVIFSIIYFIRQHQGLAIRLRRSRLAQLLKFTWQWLTGNVKEMRGSLVRVITNGWHNFLSRLEAQRLTPRSGWISIRSLDPRRQVYFFYLTMIRRTNERGLARKSSQTPSEYAAMLETMMPDANEDIQKITNEFMQARYSDHRITNEDSNLAKIAWGKIRKALQLQRGQKSRKA